MIRRRLKYRRFPRGKHRASERKKEPREQSRERERERERESGFDKNGKHAEKSRERLANRPRINKFGSARKKLSDRSFVSFTKVFEAAKRRSVMLPSD